MAEYIRSEDSPSVSSTRKVAVANGVTVTNGDFVGYASGRVTSAGIATAEILGYVLGGNANLVGRSQRTNAANVLTAVGNVAGTVEVLVVVEAAAIYLIEATANLAKADEGKYFNLSGATGAQKITATAVADKGQFQLVEAGPNIRGRNGLTWGIFRLANTKKSAA